MFNRILREPLLHFLAAGLLLYLTDYAVEGPSLSPGDEKQIVVDRATLLTYMQYQSNAFDSAAFERALDALGSNDLQQLIDAYVAEEVLYREAAALGLERSDYIIRQRMIDKMRFLLADISSDDGMPDDSELQAWLEENRELYRVQAAATFTHVFISSANDASTTQAVELLRELNDAQLDFNDASAQGDRFPFLRNYVERTLEFVAGHFGQGFVDELQKLQPDTDTWQGPLQSEYGQHLVLLTALAPARDPLLDEVRADITRDFLAARREERLTAMIQKVREQYSIEVQDLQQEAPE